MSTISFKTPTLYDNLNTEGYKIRCIAYHLAAHVLVGLLEPRLSQHWRVDWGRDADASVIWEGPASTPMAEIRMFLAGSVSDAIRELEECGEQVSEQTVVEFAFERMMIEVSPDGDADGDHVIAIASLVDGDDGTHSPKVGEARVSNWQHAWEQANYDRWDAWLHDEAIGVAKLLLEHRRTWEMLAERIFDGRGNVLSGHGLPDHDVPAEGDDDAWSAARKAWGVRSSPRSVASQDEDAKVGIRLVTSAHQGPSTTGEATDDIPVAGFRHASPKETVVQVRGTKEHVLRALAGILTAMGSEWSATKVLNSLCYGRHKGVPAEVGHIQVHLYRAGHPGEVLDAPDDALCDLHLYHQGLRPRNESDG